ncbi:ankyrin repeat domain-containing protein [unidentified bacterial endosymbiont]|uniref:ankyrin repeat domain-containing protein n=1 Tax=unidentified bacterial endosymbiont TaxID=2355 RepID=UPI00209D0624|nr:ankyrin repeat domain-containing protein [unidentified bacterial endosymbiont]
MYFINSIHKASVSGQQQSVADEQSLKLLNEEYSKLLEAVHHGDKKAVESTLTKYPALLNRTDAQGNTPLHYAVAQHNLGLIEFLIQQGAVVTTQNQQGETAGDWYKELLAGMCTLEKLFDSTEMLQLVEKNNVQVITDYLKLEAARSLRFSRGSTLLHLAVELQKPAVVKVILEGITPEKIDQLLKLKNSQGDTPLDLAEQKLYPYVTPVAQEIFAVLQQPPTTTPGESVPMSQPLPTAWQFLIDKTTFNSRVNKLSKKLKNPIVVADFEQLNPLREVICRLAYTTCCQALPRLSKLERQNSLEETWPYNLFGCWGENTQLEFQKKLQAIVGYLANIIQQQQVNQVIHFSNEISYDNGWHFYDKNTIYLNPTAKKNNLVSLVVTLIHEATHMVNQSYDFVTMADSVDSKGYTVDLSQAYQLASTGESEELTPERVKLFELRQRLQEGDRPGWRQRLHHWMALNNADTQTLAILLLATLPEKYAKFDNKQQTLLIKEKFLSEAYLNKHPTPLPLTAPSPLPVPEPPVTNAHPSSDDQLVLSHTATTTSGSVGKLFKSLFKKQPEEQQVTSPQSPKPKRDASYDSLSTNDRTPSPPPRVTQAVAAYKSSDDRSGFLRTETTNRSIKTVTNPIIPKGSSD